MFTKAERSSFPYWFAHWCAFQMTALNLKAWKFKYLFHDFEKPWLMWLWKDYKRVQKWHRNHNSHHLEYPGTKDWEAMAIDWECSRFTKVTSPLTAYGEMCRKLEKYNKTFQTETGIDGLNAYQIGKTLEENMLPVLVKLNLVDDKYHVPVFINKLYIED